MKQYHIIFMRAVALLLRTILLVPLMVHAANLQVTLSPAPYSTMTLTGSVTISDVTQLSSGNPPSPSTVIGFRAPGYSYDLPGGNSLICNATSVGQFVNEFNSWLAQGIVLINNGSSPITSGATRGQISISSICSPSKAWFTAGSNPELEAEIVNPPSPKSVCTVNSQNLNLNYSSTNLNVNGLSQSTNLYISCGSGDAQNYQLRLTGSNVTSGRLNFGNGVSAQVSLNGVQVSANGSGISLNGLTSRNISVSATLVGSASTSGITNSNGVLVLDAL